MGALWRHWRDRFFEAGIETAALDARLLAGQALGLSALELATREGDAVDPRAGARLAALAARRLAGESVGRIQGQRAFYGLDFALNAATLEPRPDTELLVDLAIAALPAGGRLLDLGTGTGCIPIAVLANRPDATAVAVDLSAEALEAALGNAERHGVGGRLDLLQGSWFEPLASSPAGSAVHLSPQGRGGERFHLIASNPPYIASAVVETLAREVREHDPRLALDGGPDGLAPYRIIAVEAGRWLVPGGQVLLEIGHDQGVAVSALLAAAGFGTVTVNRDLAGLDRVVSAHHV